MFINGPRSLAYNNARPANTYPFQSTNFDSSRAGQWDNSQGFLGISNPVYGTLTFGRTNSLAIDVTLGVRPGRVDRLLADRLLGFVRRLWQQPRRFARTPPSPIA